MYAQCPGCLTIYRVPVEVIAQAHGRARCGVCRIEFDILTSLAENLPGEPDAMLPRRGPGPVPLLAVAATRPKSGQRDLFVELPEPAETTPGFVQRPASTPRPTAPWPWLTAVNVLLLLCLLGQAAYASRGLWLNDSAIRPWLDAACERLQCRLPARRDLGQIALVARDVRPHPSVAGALMISATLQNRAGFLQPYPSLEITLSDLNERRIAMRRLAPQDYLDDAAALARGLPPGATATIDLEVADPGKQAVAFEFKFL
ncbi:MAG: zinc-ribbon and DUF3426 domain-containing protein [Lysobacterales bacterium]